MQSMRGYRVVTADDESIGHVVGTRGEHLVVERGRLFKARHLVPLVFTHADDDAETVRVTLSKRIIEDSPKLGGDGGVDEHAVAEHYGLASAFADPPAAGRGETQPTDPAYGPEADLLSAGDEPATKERVEIRERMRRGSDDPGAA